LIRDPKEIQTQRPEVHAQWLLDQIGVVTGQSRLCADLYQLMRRVEKQQSHTLSSDRLWQDRRIGVETLASAQAESRT